MKHNRRVGQRATGLPALPRGRVRVRPRLEHLEDRLLLAASLLADVNTVTGSSGPTEPAVFNGVVYFQASDGVHGRELWRSDGTAEGTYMVKDINLGPDDSNPSDLTIFNGAIYFAAEDATTGGEL